LTSTDFNRDKMKLIIAGTRTFTNYELLEQEAIDFIGDETDVEIVSGMAQGADKLGEQFAEEFGYRITRFPAKWAVYGRSAGPIRNEEMAQYATHCLCFWDGKSTGTRGMMKLASQYGLRLRTVLYLNIEKHGRSRNKRGPSGRGGAGVPELV
jgi:hypothetical protein